MPHTAAMSWLEYVLLRAENIYPQTTHTATTDGEKPKRSLRALDELRRAL